MKYVILLMSKIFENDLEKMLNPQKIILLFLVIVLGIGYFIVSKDIAKNHGIMIKGIIAKLSFFVVCLVYFLIGDIGILTLLVASLDIAFSALFIEFLLNFKKL